MNWGELLEYLYEKSIDDVNFLQEAVTVWDMDEGHLFIGIKGDACAGG